MGALREFFMWAVFQEYEEAAETKMNDTAFFRKVSSILEQLNNESVGKEY